MDETFWRWTRHALIRCAEMGLQPRSVEHVLAEPLTEYPTHQRRRVRCANGLAIIFDPNDGAIVTILWDKHDRRWPEPAVIAA